MTDETLQAENEAAGGQSRAGEAGANLTVGLECCPVCNSEDIAWCNISVRPYCNECRHWGRVNFGTAEDAKNDWNNSAYRHANER